MHGKKFDAGKLDWSLLPLSFVKPLVPIFALGEKRYGFENWKRDFENEQRRFLASLKRHLEEVEEHGPLAINDDDDGVYHAAQIAWNALRLLLGALRHERKKGRGEYDMVDVKEEEKDKIQPFNASNVSAFCRCSMCGYSWQRGMNGSHSCADQLMKMIESIRRVASGENQVADDDTGGLKWIADYISTSLGR